MSTEPVEPRDALLAGLAARAGSLAEAANDLRESYRFSRWLKVTIALGVAMLVANGVMLGILVSLASTNRANGDAIRSCTTPAGECYQRGQKSTAEAVAQIVAAVNAHTDLVFIASLQCSRHQLSSPKFTACLHSKGVQ